MVHDFSLLGRIMALSFQTVPHCGILGDIFDIIDRAGVYHESGRPKLYRYWQKASKNVFAAL